MNDDRYHIFPKAYLFTAIVLFALLVLTISVSFLPLGGFSLPIASAIAFTKVFLVMWYFMHVRENTRLVWIFAFGAFVWLALLFALTFGDYVTREEIQLPITEIESVENHK